MPNLNKVIIIGHLGQSPDIKQAASTKIANFSVATSERYKDKNTGENKVITEWHKVVFFGKLAEIAEAYLTKGSAVYIEGKLKTEDYTDKDGIQRYVTKIIGNNMQMLGERDKGGAEKSAVKKEENQISDDQFSDDIPF